jgi:hypothetical protein
MDRYPIVVDSTGKVHGEYVIDTAYFNSLMAKEDNRIAKGSQAAEVVHLLVFMLSRGTAVAQRSVEPVPGQNGLLAVTVSLEGALLPGFGESKRWRFHLDSTARIVDVVPVAE